MVRRTDTFTLVYPKGQQILCVIDHTRNYIAEHLFHNKFIFKPDVGYQLLLKTIREKPDKIHLLNIVNNTGKTYTVEQFFNILEYCALR